MLFKDQRQFLLKMMMVIIFFSAAAIVFSANAYSARIIPDGKVLIIRSKQRFLDVMALGGGLSDKAGRVMQIRRHGGSVKGQDVFIVDLDQLIKEGRSELNLVINSSDVLFVAEAGTFFVDGAVRRPGAYSIKHKTTIQEALLEAGVLAPYANKDHAVLARYTEKGERQMLKLDLLQPETLEMEVKDRDVLITEASAIGKLVHCFRISIGIPGFGGLGYRNPER